MLVQCLISRQRRQARSRLASRFHLGKNNETLKAFFLTRVITQGSSRSLSLPPWINAWHRERFVIVAGSSRDIELLSRYDTSRLRDFSRDSLARSLISKISGEIWRISAFNVARTSFSDCCFVTSHHHKSLSCQLDKIAINAAWQTSFSGSRRIYRPLKRYCLIRRVSNRNTRIRPLGKALYVKYKAKYLILLEGIKKIWKMDK